MKQEHCIADDSFQVLSLIPALFLTFHSQQVSAADTDFSKWLCKLCVVYDGWYGDLDIGIGYASEDSLRFGDYRGIEQEGFYAAVDGELHYRNPADRGRDYARVDFDFYPVQALAINLNYFKASSDYEKSPLGLQQSEDQSYTINLNYAAGSRLNFYAFYTRDEIDADMVNATSISATPWNAVTRELITLAGTFVYRQTTGSDQQSS